MAIVRLDGSEGPGRSVFVATGTARARALRWLGLLTGALLLLWLVALIAGAVGVGRLPAVPLPAIGALRHAPAADAPRHAAPLPSHGRTTIGGSMRRGSTSFPSGTRGQRSAGDGGGVPRGGSRTAPGRTIGSRRPADGGARPAPGGQPAPAAPPSGTAPGGTPPARPRAPGRGTTPSQRPPTAGGSATPPANRPVDPPAGGTTPTTPSTTRPVDPPTAPPGTTRSSTAG